MNISHEMLIANAGSGKTYRLTIRTIKLLALGVAPGKIAALTFTRKAAAEFLSAVFLRLAKAASDPAALAILQRDTQLPELDAAKCRALLVNLTAQMHRLSMGTIDSLFGRMARCFPLETGLAGDFSVLGDSARQSVMRDTLATLFREQGEDESRFLDFLDLVRQQSRKQSEREVFRTLLDSVNNLHEKFLATPSNIIWGDKKTIWPGGSPILNAGDVVSAADNLWLAIDSTHPDLDPKAIDWWQIALQAARETLPGKSWSKEVEALFKKQPSSDADGREYFPTGGAKKARVYLNPSVTQMRAALIHALLKPKLEDLIRRSRALHGLLAGFESTYKRLVRNQGQLTFSDITSVLARQVDSPEWRATVGYRMDSQFDHWLLDEFQDTSRLQWKVLGNLVDDIIQDNEGQRSFFYVGDTKQSLYSFRGGDPRLFFEISNYYNQSGSKRISHAAPLDVSYRSDKEIIELVNNVFGNLADHAATLTLPEKTVADWTQAWVKHEYVSKTTGYVRWQPIEKDSSDDEVGSPTDCEILRILQETRPWERGWSCAALKRTNKGIGELAALLQGQGIPVALEGKSNPCTDNPLGVALLAAFAFAASPEDQLSHALLLTSPFANVWLTNGEWTFREKTLTRIAAEGFSGTTQSWLDQIDLTDEPFLALRARDFLSAATDFDNARQTGDDIASFLHHIENYSRQEPEGTGVVRIMTIHQAKGLTLDMTILSGLDEPFSDDKTSGTLALEKNRNGDSWGLLMPGSDISKTDDILGAVRQDLLATSAYGEICSAYVAMTRPKHALYLLTKKLPEKTTTKNLARLLTLTLSTIDGYETGNREWYLAGKKSDTALPQPLTAVRTLPSPLRGTPRSLGPSSLVDANANTRWFSADAANMGTEIHSALAQIKWLPGILPNFETLSRASAILLDQFLKSSAAKLLFKQPETPHRLWRERAFECLLDGRWVAGVFDRVLIHLDETGKPISAEVIDFKTTSSDSATLQKRYEAQLTTYRRAASFILGIDPARISSRIVSVC